jgi:bifunctional non-homologous end joining protein LigD
VALDLYRRKRKFDLTSEPRGKRIRAKGDSFVVQKHAARRLHYDFRLELDGVLKSWAVTRGPSLVPGEKRLAVHVEDHPLDYGEFEGTIPKGQYGGGTVMLWDRGRWIPEGDSLAGYKKGHLTFTLEGEKLKGRWHLVRMRPRAGDKHENWLLIKAEDAEARGAADPDILEQDTLSVATRRSLEEIAQGKAPKVRSKVKAAAVWNSVARSERASAAPAAPPDPAALAPTPAPNPAAVAPGLRSEKSKRRRQDMGARNAAASASLPDFVPPALAELAAAPPDGANFVHEIKFDGYRMQARLDHGAVTLKTRNGLDWTARFRPVAEAVASLPANTALIDGEVVVEDKNGVSSFSALQSALKESRAGSFVYYVFDFLHLDGRDLAGAPLIERKTRLETLLAKGPSNPVLRMSEHLSERGTVVFDHACRMGLEGIVSKRIDAPYRSGRTRDWLKSKCSARQEFVVGGFTLATGSRRAIGALAVGVYEDGKLRYAGRIGTGYTQETAEDLWKRLDLLRIGRSPFASLPADERRRNVIWVRPELVIEADLRGWTGGGLVRQAAFKGVREDKAPTDVIRETPPVTASAGAKGRRGKASPGPAPKQRQSRATAATTNPGALDIKFTNPDRVYWPDIGVTKRALADYYTAVWEWMAPHVVRRPLALLRCPNGVGSECFVQKHAHATFDRRRILSVDDHGEEIVAIENLDGLLALAQAGVLEVHVWGSTIDHIELCDRIVFDLDPGLGVAWSEVIAAAREVRDRLAALGLTSFVKTSGGKGLHIVAPFDGADWTTTKEFTRQIALAMSRDAPTKYLARMTKSARQGRIFIDYLRNGRGATAIAAYSPRARAGAPVSTPVDWTELNGNLSPDRYTVLNLQRRLSRLRSDPWAEMGKVRQQLPVV